MPCQFTNDDYTCGREGYKQQADGEWRCIHHLNVGYHRHHINGVWIYEKPYPGCTHIVGACGFCCGCNTTRKL